jgi:AraC-like DNA-binding protein
MKLKIKNIVCPCCRIYVQRTLNELNMKNTSLGGGEFMLETTPSPEQLDSLTAALQSADLEIFHDFQNNIIENVKTLIGELIYNNGNPMKVNISDYLAEKTAYNYSYLSNLFTRLEGMTIREYVIGLRIERAKYMLTHEGLDLFEISYLLHYSSAAHLAAQFKKVTGMTTSEFKRHQLREAASTLEVA